MSTHATIIEKKQDQYRSIYVHFDGYVEGLGETLHEYWNDSESISEMIDLGDASSIGSDLDHCEFYGRDRGEADTGPQVCDDINQALDSYNDYRYLWDGDKWHVYVDNADPFELETAVADR